MNQPVQTENRLISVVNQKAVTTSLKVAEIFEKQHKNVLQNIQTLGCSEQFGRLNFQPSSYQNAQNRKQPMYIITRDGFTLLVMGFTGPKAMQWKERYIAAFNNMEARLLQHKNRYSPSQILTRVARMEEKLDQFLGAGNTLPAGRFATEQCNISAGSKTHKQTLFEAYETWCQGKKLEPSAYNTFFRELYTAIPLLKPCTLKRQPAVSGIALREVN